MRYLLFPFSLLYGLVTRIRNLFFDFKILTEQIYEIPLITVGNIRSGGTGKSPLVEYLTRLLSEDFMISILSRGYGRKTKGLLEAVYPASAIEVGDEPAQIKNKFPEIRVVVSEDRRNGIQYLNQGAITVENKMGNGTGSTPRQVIILDDAFQHRKVKAGLNLVLLEYKDVFRPKILLPAGNYREGISALKRAQAIIITKNSTLPSNEESLQIRMKLRLKDSQPLYFSFIEYQQPVLFSNSSLYAENSSNAEHSTYAENSTLEINVPTNIFFGQEQDGSEQEKPRTIILLTGIGNPKPLLEYLNKDNTTIIHLAYPDHHTFSLKEIKKLKQVYQGVPESNKFIITTEKDAQRLKSKEFESELANLPLYYIPIKNSIWTNGPENFDTFITNYVRSL